jgi:UDP-3-O-[3-hydroxymyristoyl] glucosamine N-acyltransferase
MILLNDILEILTNCKVSGDLTDKYINRAIQLDTENKDANALMWINEQNTLVLQNLQAGVIICPENSVQQPHPNCVYLEVKHPRKAFQMVLDHFFKEKQTFEIAKSAVIHPTAKIGKNTYIGEFVIIEAGCQLGDFARIDHHSVLKKGTIIHNSVTIGANCVIGGVGFGYEKDDAGNWKIIQHLGNVVLHDHVEIGNGTMIDRAVLGSTVLHENVKVDNLVHIGHGVQIGRNTLIIANAMIAGSVIIGENVWVSPSASVLNKITIGSHAQIGLGAVVIRPVETSAVIVGNPGKALETDKN